MGRASANCDRANVNNCYGFTSPVCEFPAGNTRQGLCDMSGGIYEWMEDDYHPNYIGAPADGSAWVDSPRAEMRILRGGTWSAAAENATVYFRWGATAPNLLALQGTSDSYGFRLARD